MILRASLISLLVGLSSYSLAEEKREKLPETLVIRIHNETQQIEIHESNVALPANQNSISQVDDRDFTAVRVNAPTSELDKDSATDAAYLYGGYRTGRFGVNVGYASGYGWRFNFYYNSGYYGGYPYYPYYPMYNSRYYCCGANYYYGGYTYPYKPYYYYPRGAYSYYYYGRRR